MMRKISLITGVICLLLLATSFSLAQEDDGTATTTEQQSTVSYFLVICADRAVMNLSGTMLAGFDVYFQIFSGAGGTGTELSALRRVEADGDYTFSEIITYPEGQTIGVGGVGSAYVAIAREGNPSSTAFTDIAQDIQDGCAEPLHGLGVSNVTDGTVSGVSDGEGTSFGAGTNAEGFSTILSPFGGVLNPNYRPPARSIVTIGPREEFVIPRQETPGLIFAECEDFRVAEPGIVYDTDDVVVFWSWFAETEAQAQAHIDNVNYSVTYYQTVPLPNVVRTTIQQINGLFWVFYYSRLGHLLPGQYWIDYKVSWDEPITDGFADFGPGTDNEILASGCSFDVLPNPEGTVVSHNTWPYQNLGAP